MATGVHSSIKSYGAALCRHLVSCAAEFEIDSFWIGEPGEFDVTTTSLDQEHVALHSNVSCLLTMYSV